MIKVAIAYPSNARVALQSLSIHIIRKLLNEHSNVYSDFVFIGDDGKSLTKSLRDFDIVIFSVHYELDYPRILKMMELSGINPYNSQRSTDDPLIVLGGPTLMANPEPMAPFADIILIGDAEVLIPQLVSHYMEYGKNIDSYIGPMGFYVPSIGKHTVTKAFVKDLSYSIRLIHDTAIELSMDNVKSIFSNPAVLEVMRGCPRGCLFCMEGFVSRPVRFADITSIKGLILRDLGRNGIINGVSLIGLSVTDHPGFKELMNFLVNELKLSVSVPSLRVDTLDRDIIRLIAKGGQRVLTIAPESSERLRKALGKGFSDDDVVKIAMDAVSVGIDHLKLYFMVGLPGEGDEDIKSIVNLLTRLKRLGIKHSLSVNPWIPKPHTPPLQWLPMADDKVINDRIKTLRDARTYNEFSAYNVLDAKVQALLALGDRDVGNLIFEASLTNLDRGGSWRRLLRKYENLLNKYVYSWKPLNGELPWSHIKIPGAEEENLKSLLFKYVNEVSINLPT